MSARTRRLREEHWNRKTHPGSTNPSARFNAYVRAMAQAAAEKVSGLAEFIATYRYVGRGRHQAKRFSSTAALTKAKPNKYSKPHQGARECARRLQRGFYNGKA